jgi:hypothetical protein
MNMQTVAYNATLFQNNVGVTGVAMRNPDNRVYFCDDRTGTWRELYDADVPNIHLHGRCDIAFSQRIIDGNLVTKVARSLVGRTH